MVICRSTGVVGGGKDRDILVIFMERKFSKRICFLQKSNNVEMDLKPTIDIINLRECAKHRRDWKRRVSAIVYEDKRHRSRATRILRKWRDTQDNLLGYEDEDPNPYRPTYVFYCLEAPCVD
jgi:hypothetical protein